MRFASRNSKTCFNKFFKYANANRNLTPDTIDEIIIKDELVPESFSSEPRCYGGTNLDENEAEVLSLPPKYALYTKIDTTECESQVEEGLAKFRWSIHSKDEDGNIRAQRSQFRNQPNKLDFQQMWATDIPFNTRVMLPKHVDNRTEVDMYSLKRRLKEITLAVKDRIENTKFENLTVIEKKGLQSLTNKVKVIYQTDV